MLRSPITAIPPLLDRMGADLAMTPSAMGALSSVPVLCFGVLTPFASAVLRRLQLNSAALWTLAIIVAGAVIRSLGSVPAAFAGTAVIAAGMTMGNLIAPMVIARNFRGRTALMTGAYSASVNVAVTLSTALAAPLALVIGWQGSAMAWAIVPGVAAGIVWWRVFPPERRAGQDHPGQLAGAALDTSAVSDGGIVPVGHRAAAAPVEPVRSGRILAWPLAWILATAFAAHTFAYYSMVAWLPTALREVAHMGESGAGIASSVFQITAVFGPLMLPVMMNRLGWPMLRVMCIICGCWLVLPFGMLVAPGLWFIWCFFGGMAQGSFFSALFTIVIGRTRTADENRRLSALVQTVGYIVAATGPVLVGVFRESHPGWTPLFGLVGLGTVVMTVCAIIGVRDTSRPPQPVSK